MSTRQNSPPVRARPATPESFYRVVRAPAAQNPIATSSFAATRARQGLVLSRAVHRAFCRSPPSAIAGSALPWPSQPFSANPPQQSSNSLGIDQYRWTPALATPREYPAFPAPFALPFWPGQTGTWPIADGPAVPQARRLPAGFRRYF